MQTLNKMPQKFSIEKSKSQSKKKDKRDIWIAWPAKTRNTGAILRPWGW